MRLSRTLALLLLAVLWVHAPSSAARPRLVVIAHGGYAFQEENNLRGKFESGFGFAYPLGRGFVLAVEFSHWTALSKESYGKLFNGTIAISPIIFAFQFEFLRNRYFFPYAMIGGAFVFSRFRIGSYISIPEVQIAQHIDDGFSPYLGLGARIALSNTVSFFSEAAYLPRTASAQTIYRDMNRGVSSLAIVANLRTVLLKFGLKLSF
jgi:hypothetical protein